AGNTMTEVPLSKAQNPQLLPRRRGINSCPLLRVCLRCVCVCVCVHFGWVKCRARILINSWFNERTPQERGPSFWETEVLQNFQENDWYLNFRMPKETFSFLCDQLHPYINPQITNMLDPVPLEKRVAVTIYKLASNVEFHDVANLFGIGTSTACNIFWEVCEALSKLRRVFVKRPKTVPEVQAIITGFERKTGFPMCAGALDGTLIPIIAPVSYPTDYYNRKGWYSVLLQGLVDHTYCFLDFDVGWPGKCHDAYVFECSRLCHKLEDGTFFPPFSRNIQGVNIPVLIVADSAYSLTSNIMKPFPEGTVRGPRAAYNASLSHARIQVEHTFGHLKGRWRCIMKRNDCQTQNVKYVVSACVVLHNFCEMHKVAYQEPQEDVLDQPETGPEQHDVPALSPAERIREALVAHIHTNQ
uniref:DDE Tnp4 domain-containing protein n=1 Tax=Cyprinus carpio TaxID=7962 RepID=A0A8C1LIX0_CYPCA